MSQLDYPIPYAANFLIFDNNGKLLSVTRKNNHNDWGLPGGKIDNGENAIQAAIRELKEETGYDIIDITKVSLIYDGLNKDKRVCTYFTNKINLSGKMVQSEEGLVDWVYPKNILEGTFGYYNHGVLTAYSFAKTMLSFI